MFKSNNYFFFFFRLNLFSFILLFFTSQLFSQQKIDQVIPNSEKKKVEQARKLFNNLKIYEGEKILKDLIKEHPNDYYYHEALVQIQRQVLRRITLFSSEYSDLLQNNSPKDTLDETENDTIKTTKAKAVVSLSNFGLNRNNTKNIEKASENNYSDPFAATQNNRDEIDDTLNTSLSKDTENTKRKLEKERKKALKHLEDFAQISYDSYKLELIRNCRAATRVNNHVDSASFYLREFLVDTVDKDILANEEAIETFEEALQDYYAKNIPSAAKGFEKTLQLYPSFYKAMLYLGDTYLLMNKDTLAFKQYKKAAELNPEKPNAHEKLAEAYYNRGKYLDAAAAIIDAILVYPQQHYFTFLQRIVSKTGKTVNLQWIQRDVFPANTSQNYDEIIAKEKTPWWHYQAAKQDIFSYYSPEGFVRPNEKTTEYYLEIYTWKKMLNNTGKQYFPFARAMEKLGYLDCYVFVTLFHQDIYGQFNEFAKKNEDKIKQYFYILINWESKKYDKVRKEFFPEETKTKEPKN